MPHGQDPRTASLGRCAHAHGVARFAGALALGPLVLLAAAAWGAPPAGTKAVCDGTVRAVHTVAALRQAIADVHNGRLRPGSVIRLGAGVFRLDEMGRPLSFKDVAGTSEDCPIVLEGAGAETIVDGARELKTHYFRSKVAGQAKLDQIEYAERDESVPGLPGDALPREELINCLKVKRASWIVIRDLTIRNCWPSALFIRDASYVTARDLKLRGATYAIAAFGASHHILIEGNDWTQDPTGEVWDRIPWGVSHHGSRGYLNGALFGGKDLLGAVVVRGNTIRNAYNGIRVKARICRTPNQCAFNRNVEIVGNVFDQVRDNPVEPEGYAANWWIHGNDIHNAHAWFSFDGVYGGPHFVFGNTGWFDDMPARRCDDRLWIADKNPAGEPTALRGCDRSRLGKVFKLGNNERHPIYVFHNSWYLRSPIAGGGRSGPLRFWNNAMEFCDPAAGREPCAEVSFFSTYDGDDFRGARISHYSYRVDNHEFRGNASNHPSFPDRLRERGYLVDGLHADDIGFESAADGDFRLKPASPLKGAGCAVAWVKDHAMVCREVARSRAPDIGAYQGTRRFAGPAFRHQDGPAGPDTPYVERPRVVAVDWSMASAGRLSIRFSVPIAYEPAAQDARRPARVTLRRKNRRALGSARCAVEERDPWAFACDFSPAVFQAEAVEAVLVPRGIVRRGGRRAPMILWAAADPRLRFAQ